jgi:hypothetical protein
MRKYKEVIRKGTTENEQQNDQNEATSETKWENIKKVLSAVAGEVDGMKTGSRGMIGVIRNTR